jgi:5-methylcytosine-specific restriction endonuclease McrA
MPKYSPSRITKILAKTGGRCWYCGVALVPHPKMAAVEDPHYLYTSDLQHIDHFTPLTAGGRSDIGNLVPACAPCNVSKNNRTLQDFRWLVWFHQQGIKPIKPEHLEWLEARGVSFRDEVEAVRFWFEQEGLEP